MTRRVESPDEATTRLEGEGLTAAERSLLWQRIETSTQKPSWRRYYPVLAMAAVVSAGLAFGVVVLRSRRPDSTACRVDPSAKTLSLEANCKAQSVRIGADEWRLAPAARIARTGSGARVLSGSVQFHVHPRSQSSFQVEVGEGHRVRVVGTVFEVARRDASGSVSVTEGVVEFVWKEGDAERIQAGQSLSWPRTSSTVSPSASASETAAPPSPRLTPSSSPTGEKLLDDPAEEARRPARSEPRSAPSTANLETVLDRVLQLKSQHRYGELTALLRRTLAGGGLGDVQRERFSYELGLALEATGNGACAHWRSHSAQFGAGRFGTSLKSKLARCDRASSP